MNKNDFLQLPFDAWFALATGCSLFLTGLTVMFGWFSGHITLIQISANLPAMQFNTALSISLSGLGLCSLILNLPSTSRILSFLVIIISSLTTFEWVFHINLGIDQFFFSYNLPTFMHFPGRMALNTAFALLYANLSIYLLNHKRHTICVLFASFFSLIVSMISFLSFTGYITGLEALIALFNTSRMAFHTMLCCLLLGLTTSAISIKILLRSNFHRIIITAGVVLIFSGGILMTLQAFRTQELFTLKKFTQQQGLALKNSIEAELAELITALNRFADRWDVVLTDSDKLWKVDAKNYINELTGLKKIALYDKKLQQIEMMSSDPNLPPIDELVLKAKELELIQQLKSSQIPLQKGNYLLISLPLIKNKEFNGVLAAEVDMKDLFITSTKNQNLSNFRISFFYDDVLLASEGDVTSPLLGKSILFKVIQDYGEWKIAISATQAVALSQDMSFDSLILLAGILITGLAGILSYIGQALQIKTIELEIINKKLNEETIRAEAATIAKGAFLATMSHEIRTPLNAIIGTIELLGETPTTEVQTKYIQRITSATKTLLELISEILDFSKIEGGGIKLEPVPINLEEITKSIAENLTFIAKKKNLEILLECPSQPIEQFMCDPTRLQQILSNLGNNSIKFTEKGSILLRYSKKAESPEASLIRFEIIDTGIGIAPENLPKLFQKFYQIDGQNTRKQGGVGLGLSICKKLVEIMGGELGVTSTVGQGSCFWVELLLQPVPKTSIPHFSANQRSVLILDSKESELKILTKYLTDWGADIQQSASNHSYDLILADNPNEASQLNNKIKGKFVLISDTHLETLPPGISGILTRPIIPTELYKWLTQEKNGLEHLL